MAVLASRPNTTDVLDRVLDKGIVIDAWIRVGLVDIDLHLVGIESRMVVASIDTYLKYHTPSDWDECPSMRGRIRMVRISCDVCGRVKNRADQQWIVGYDLEVETRSGLHRTVQFLDRWNDWRVLEFGVIHLCSEKCRDKYLAVSRAA